jgi:tRNA(Ile)-lysidine synthase
MPTSDGSQPLPFETKLAAAWPAATWRDVTVLLAVSGGADSVALLRGMAAIEKDGAGRLIVAHFNHRLRAAESDADEAFVADLCQSLGIALEVGRANSDELTAAGKDGLEAAARAARYRFLEDTGNRFGARYLVTAHTADDQAETILHRILRGTGLAGLSGIPRVRVLNPAIILMRPMLEFRRAEVLAYLNALNQPYRNDATNSDPAFTRNRLRNELLPQLSRDYNANVIEAVLRLGALADQAQSVIDGLVDGLMRGCVEREGKRALSINCDALGNVTPYLIREVLIAVWRQQDWPQQDMSYDKWDELASFVLPPVGAGECGGRAARAKKVFPGGVCAEKQRELLTLTRPEVLSDG